MSNSNGAALGIIAFIIYAIAWVGTGTMAWNIVEPQSFWGAIKFLIVWAIFGMIVQFVATLIIGAIAALLE